MFVLRAGALQKCCFMFVQRSNKIYHSFLCERGETSTNETGCGFFANTLCDCCRKVRFLCTPERVCVCACVRVRS